MDICREFLVRKRRRDYSIKEGHRNILFILTDGYMYMSGTNNKDSNNKSNYVLSNHLSRWGFNLNNYQSKLDKEGFASQVPITGLEDLEVFVIGFAPKNNWEMDVLNSYWANWLNDMGVKTFKTKIGEGI